MEKYQNTSLSPKERAEDLLLKLSIEEKMAQTVSIFPMYSLMGMDSVEMSKKDCRYGIGSVSTLEMKDMPSVEAVRDYQIRMQTMIMEQSPHHIPAAFHMEGLCGAFIQDSLSIPSGISRGSTWDPELEEKLAGVVSRQERSLGISQILAPVLDINRDPRMGRIGESYGEDPTLAAAMGTAFTKGIQDGERPDGLKAESVAKHFLGFHNSLGGIHGTESMTGPRLLDEIYGRPFQAAIAEANLRGIMPCYDTIDGEATSSSHRLLTELLRGEMGFDGIVCSDYSAISNEYNFDGLYNSPEEAGYESMKAGMDMEWPSAFGYNDALCDKFKRGEVSMEVLDTAVLRILEAKFRMGLFEHPFALQEEDLKAEFYGDKDADYALTLRAAEESLVLLKNDGILPMSAAALSAKGIKKIAVIGAKADNARILFGGYTHMAMTESFVAQRNSIAGIGATGQLIMKDDIPTYPGTQIQPDETDDFDAVLRKQKPDCPSILDELKRQLPDVEFIYSYGYPVAGDDKSHYKEALAAIESADAAILVLGGKWSSGSISTTGEGVDTTNINLPECQEDFIKFAAKAGKPMVGIHLDGRPISSDAADEFLNAILEAWAPSEAGAKAIAHVITGAVNPSGKLPVSVARNAGQIPVFYNHPNGSSTHQATSIGFTDYVDMPHAPRYPFGYGLSYTEFEYSDIAADRTEADAGTDEAVTVTFTVTNVGSTAGCEVAQLYLKDVRSGMVRPNMELAGFKRIELAPSESRQVSLKIHPSQSAYLDLAMKWKVEAGEIGIMVGAASDDIRLQTSYNIKNTVHIDGRSRKFYSI